MKERQKRIINKLMEDSYFRNLCKHYSSSSISRNELIACLVDCVILLDTTRPPQYDKEKEFKEKHIENDFWILYTRDGLWLTQGFMSVWLLSKVSNWIIWR